MMGSKFKNVQSLKRLDANQKTAKERQKKDLQVTLRPETPT